MFVIRNLQKENMWEKVETGSKLLMMKVKK